MSDNITEIDLCDMDCLGRLFTRIISWTSFKGSTAPRRWAILTLAFVLLNFGCILLGFHRNIRRKDAIRASYTTQGRKDTAQYTSTHDADFKLNPKDLCYSDGVQGMRIVVLICSSPLNSDARIAIRRTWLLQKRPISNVTVHKAFVLGRMAGDHAEHIQQTITRESYKYGDIIQANFVDSYFNLTIKTIWALRWAAKHCPQTDYVIKGDDDAYINLPNVARYLLHNGPSRGFLGYHLQGIRPMRNPAAKWYVSPDVYSPLVFPDFAAGWAYIFSSNILNDLLLASDNTTFLYLEDVFLTGLCRLAINASISGHSEFKATIDISNPKELTSFFAIHFVTVEKQYKTWQAVQKWKSTAQQDSHPTTR